MPGRGLTRKHNTEGKLTLERMMVTRHYVMTWDLERCVGCDLGPLGCPKQAVVHIPGDIEDGRLTGKPAIDIDADKCVLCGICEELCPTNAITLTINGSRENPVLSHGAFPRLTRSTIFNEQAFDRDLRQQVIDNCPTHVIQYDATTGKITVDEANCIHCRQCEVASKGAFEVIQPWEGRVTLDIDRCVPGCRACADICPTRALYLSTTENDSNLGLHLADYYCIKCGACMQVCPVKAEYEEKEQAVEFHGVTKTITTRHLLNADQLPIRVERWRSKHEPVESAAWIHTLRQLADDKAGVVEIDRKRALRRRDLVKALGLQ